jgi:flagellar biosynthesis GTPase FlhF
MKRLSVVGAIFTSLVLGAAITAVAQDEPKKEEHKQEEAKPAARQEQAKPEEHRNQEQQNEERRQEPKQDEHQMQKQQENQRREMQQQDKQQEKMDKQQGREQERREQAQPQQTMPNREQGRPQHAQNQRHIPEQDFHSHFGREHRFHPGRMQVNAGRPQFRYSGYMFELVEVWPTDWAYDSDDYYIDYFGDEYWLCSFSHPDIRLELVIIG